MFSSFMTCGRTARVTPLKAMAIIRLALFLLFLSSISTHGLKCVSFPIRHTVIEEATIFAPIASFTEDASGLSLSKPAGTSQKSNSKSPFDHSARRPLTLDESEGEKLKNTFFILSQLISRSSISLEQLGFLHLLSGASIYTRARSPSATDSSLSNSS